MKNLKKLYEQIKNDKKERIKKDIINLKMGIEGEKYVAYELKNSYIPMICLHDIRIEHEGNVAQLDFVVITRYFIMILETKKLNGDIRINEQDEFIRIFKNNDGRAYHQKALYDKLVKYRYDKSIEENIKAYCIFSNATLEDIIKVRPKTMVELLKVKGIGIDKTRKYGDDILKILL